MKAKKSDRQSTKPTEGPLLVSAKIARRINRLEEYSKLRGIPLEDVLVECFSEYIAAVVHPAKS
jgi:hypothetical protein